ncbi:MAG: FliI/YscN family ATPase [Nitrospirota bacterium]|nr:FliI/YscN family ATPase [Nitrospirota bacterium]MDH5295768.1 FliI/YscN family ATPase [Nitrospirota bacterium]
MSLAGIQQRLDEISPVTITGRVVKAVGLTLEGTGLGASVGQRCHVFSKRGQAMLEGEVIGFREQRVVVMPFGAVRGIAAGNLIRYDPTSPRLLVGPQMLGRVLDGLGQPLDGKGPLSRSRRYALYAPAPAPMVRQRITEPMDLGLRSINAMLTCGVGQKLGIFAGSGVGKSVLMGMMCRHTTADVNVIALVGERGREVKEFLERDLGREGLRRSVVVVATSDQSPLVRVRAAFVATAIAEFFRDQGNHVLLLVDSLTRLAHAQREVGLAAGEPPTTKGYPPSVFTLFPQVLERVGAMGTGSITGLYTVLVDGDDLNDPIADSIRSILDGHIVLSRRLAMQGHFPAIDVLQSVSRVMSDIASTSHLHAARFLVQMMSEYRNAEDLINLGAYQPGTNPRLDAAIQMKEPIDAFLRQNREEGVGITDSCQGLESLAEQGRRLLERKGKTI